MGNSSSSLESTNTLEEIRVSRNYFLPYGEECFVESNFIRKLCQQYPTSSSSHVYEELEKKRLKFNSRLKKKEDQFTITSHMGSLEDPNVSLYLSSLSTNLVKYIHLISSRVSYKNLLDQRALVLVSIFQSQSRLEKNAKRDTGGRTGIKKVTLLNRLYKNCSTSEKEVLKALVDIYLPQMPSVASLAPEIVIPRTANVIKYEDDWDMWGGGSDGLRRDPPIRRYDDEEYDDGGGEYDDGGGEGHYVDEEELIESLVDHLSNDEFLGAERSEQLRTMISNGASPGEIFEFLGNEGGPRITNLLSQLRGGEGIEGILRGNREGTGEEDEEEDERDGDEDEVNPSDERNNIVLAPNLDVVIVSNTIPINVIPVVNAPVNNIVVGETRVTEPLPPLNGGIVPSTTEAPIPSVTSNLENSATTSILAPTSNIPSPSTTIIEPKEDYDALIDADFTGSSPDLLSFLLKVVVENALIIHKNTHGSPEKKDATTPITSPITSPPSSVNSNSTTENGFIFLRENKQISPSLKLLALLQRDLFKKVAQQILLSSNDGKVDLVNQARLNSLLKTFNVYLDQLLLYAVEILQKYSKKPDDKVMKSNFIGVLIPSTLVCLYEMIQTPSTYLLLHECYEKNQILIEKMILLFDGLNENNEKVKVAASAYQEKINTFLEDESKSGSMQRVVESQHNIQTSGVERKVVHIPGASHLILCFDPRCSTENNNSYLQLTDALGENISPICYGGGGGGGGLRGSQSYWPRSLIVLKGDTVVFKYLSNAYATNWGYRVIVRGVLTVPPIKLPLFYDLQRTCGYLLASLMNLKHSSLKLTTSEKDNTIWLSSFHREETSDSEKKEFLSNLIARDSLTHGGQLGLEIDKLLPKTLSDSFIGPLMRDAINTCQAALLHHSAIIGEAMSLKIEESLVKVPIAAQFIMKKLIEIFSNGKQVCDFAFRERDRLLQLHSNCYLSREDMAVHVKKRAEFLLNCKGYAKNNDLKFNDDWFPENLKKPALLMSSVSAPTYVPDEVDLPKPSLLRTNSEEGSKPKSGVVDVFLKTSLLRSKSDNSSKKTKFSIDLEKDNKELALNFLLYPYKALDDTQGNANLEGHVDESARVEESKEHDTIRESKEEDSIKPLATGSMEIASLSGELLNCLVIQNQRRICRTKIVETIFKFISDKSLACQDIGVDMLDLIPKLFRQEGKVGQKYPAHYLTHLNGCSDGDILEFKNAMYKLYKSLLSSFTSNNTWSLQKNRLFIIKTIDCWCLEWTDKDYDFLISSKILEELELLKSSSASPKSSFILNSSELELYDNFESFLTIRFLNSNKIDDFLKFSVDNDLKITKFHSFQDSVAENLIKKTKAYFDSYLDKKEKFILQKSSKNNNISLSLSSDFDSINGEAEIFLFLGDHHHAEEACYKILKLVSCSFLSSVGNKFLSSSFSLNLFFSILQKGTPRLRRITCHVLRRILPTMEEFSVNAILYSKINPRESLIQYIGEYIGQLLIGGLKLNAIDEPLPSFFANHVNENGDVIATFASELLMLFRALLSSPFWKESALKYVTNTLLQVPKVIDDSDNNGKIVDNVDSSMFYHIVASLCIIGGHTDRIRIGGRANRVSASSASAESGSVVSFDRCEGSCRIVFDSNLSRSIECELSRIQPMPEVLFDQDSFQLTNALLEVLIKFTSRNIALEDESQSVKVSSPTKKEKEKILVTVPVSTPSVSWNCEVCTFENTGERYECEICLSPCPVKTASREIETPTLNRVSSTSSSKSTKTEEDNSTNCNDVVYLQLRYRALKALTILLKKPSNCNLLFSNEDSMMKICTIALDPIKLGSFQNIIDIEQSVERFCELWYQKLNSSCYFIEEMKVSNNLLNENDKLLPYSPFKHLQIRLPSSFNRNDSSGVLFRRGEDALNLRTIQAATGGCVACARSNHSVPNSVPAFYFEIEILSTGVESGSEEDINGVALGFTRHGIPMEGTPGSNNSFAFVSGNGKIYNFFGPVPYGSDYTEKVASAGSVIGCCWDLKASSVFFTIDGIKLPVAFELSKKNGGQFLPSVWLPNQGSTVRINFGQSPFKYDFINYLPPGYTESSSVSVGPKYTPQQIERMTVAEMLVGMFGVFPVELCCIALERNQDNLDFAANWLMEQGYQEMERMQAQFIARSEREAVEIDLATAAANSIQNFDAVDEIRSDVVVNEITATNDDDWDIDDADAEAMLGSTGRDLRSYLDDEVGQDAPASLRSANSNQLDNRTLVRQRNSPAISANLGVKDIENVHIGSFLRVNNLSSFPSSNNSDFRSFPSFLEGRVGLCVSVNVNLQLIELKFVDNEINEYFNYFFKCDELSNLNYSWKDPGSACKDSGGKLSFRSIYKSMAETETLLSVMRLRHVVLSLFAMSTASDSINLESIGGIDSVIKLLKLGSTDFLKSNSSLNSRNIHPLLSGFESYLKKLLSKEVSSTLTADAFNLSKLNISYNSLTNSNLADVIKCPEGAVPYTRILSEQVIQHFTQASLYPPAVEVRESKHPYEPMTDERHSVHIEGASRLLVSFSSQCDIASDALSSLTFYLDESYSHRIATHVGSSRTHGAFAQFVVEGDKFYTIFKSGPQSDHYGYQFSVVPLNLRISDESALLSRNVELGVWLMDLLLKNSPAVFKYEYLIDIFDSILLFTRKSRGKTRARGFELLVRILQEIKVRPSYLPERRVELGKLQGIMRVIENLIDREQAMLLHSSYLQSLLELMVTAHLGLLTNEDGDDAGNSLNLPPMLKLFMLAKEQANKKEETKEGGPRIIKSFSGEERQKVPAESFGLLRLEIETASFGVANKRVNVTPQIQQLLLSQGGTILVIPSDFSHIPSWPPLEPGVSKDLRIKYRILSQSNVILKEQLSNAITSGKRPTDGAVIRADLSPFERLVEASKLSTSICLGEVFPLSFAIDAFRYNNIGLNRDKIVVLRGKKHLNSADGFVDPACAMIGLQFAISFWIYASNNGTTPSSETKSNIIYRGGFCRSNVSNCFFPHITKVKGHSRESFQIEMTVSTGANSIETIRTVDTPENVLLNYKEWIHVICTCDAKSLSIFINGVENSTRLMKSSLFVEQSSSPLYVGSLPPGIGSDKGMNGFDGEIAEIKYFCAPLTSSEITSSYGSNKPRDKKRRKSFEDFSSSPSITPKKNKNKNVEKKHVNLIPIDGGSDLLTFQATQSKWTERMDKELVEVVSRIAEASKPKKLASEISCNEVKNFLTNRPDFILQYVNLRDFSLESILSRVRIIGLVNVRIGTCLPLVDFKHSEAKWSLAYRLCGVRHLLYMETKSYLWDIILEGTMSRENKPSVQVNRMKAIKAKEKGDPEGRRSVFGQVYRQLSTLPPSMLRQRDRAWHITYIGEASIDAGGPFRDSISHMCAELQSENFISLLIPCPNASGFGNNQEKWLPNPSINQTSSPLHYNMLNFVGKLMGIAIRGKHCLNFDLPSIIWKQLVGAEVYVTDLEAVDNLLCKMLEEIRNPSDDINSENFAEYYKDAVSTFTVNSSDGRVVELVPGGSKKMITWDNRIEWCDLVLNYRLNEFTTQVEAIKGGINAIVPTQLLPLFTWRELELKVCGRYDIDIDFLRENTIYRHPFHKEDNHVKMLWEVLTEYSHKERELFLRFVWGRSRLPLEGKDFNQKFEIMASHRNNNNILPSAHTCFFQLELPTYSTITIMKEKILYAITSCIEVDTDGQANNTNQWVDDDE